MSRLLSILVVFSLLALVSCASSSPRNTLAVTGTPGVDAVGCAEAVTKVDAAHMPEGVDPRVFNELKQELKKLLLEYGKTTNIVPTDDQAPAVLSWDDATSTLSWLYENRGDYDQNGEVNTADLTPLAIHFMESGEFPPGSVQWIIDGDGNGEINLADVTPIAINFRCTISQYNVYSSNNASDIPAAYADPSTIDPLGSIAISEVDGDSGTLRLGFNFISEPSSTGHFFWIRPSDGVNEGMPSTVAGPNQPPSANLVVVPWIGQPLGADFDATASNDPDGSISSYEIDFTGDGSVDYTGANALNLNTFAAPGTFTAQLTVTDDDGAFDIASVQYVIADVGGGVGALDRNGGTLNLGDISVTAAPGVLFDEVEVSAYQTDMPEGLPEGFVPGGPAYNIRVGENIGMAAGGDLLNAPLDFTFPYDESAFGDEDNVSVLYYDQANGFKPTTILNLDRESNLITVDSRIFNVFVVGWFDVGQIHGGVDTVDGYTMIFAPEANGWNIGNFGNYFASGGNCFGMSAYCTWFYWDRQWENLFPKFSKVGGNPTSIAHLMCARAHLAQNQYWAIQEWKTQITNDDAMVSLLLRIYIKVFEEPQILCLGVDGKPKHACVVYGWDDTGFIFYDVNSPGNVKHLDYDASTGFGTYGSYNTFGFCSSPSLGRAEDFEHLTIEGEGGFLSSQDISLTSPTHGEEITSGTVNIVGSLSGDLNPLAELIAYVNGVFYLIPVYSGSFFQPLPIAKGDNTIILIAGSMHQSDWQRNGATIIRDVTGTNARATLSVIGKWNKNLADLDIYVTEPDGPPVWPGNERSANQLRYAMGNESGYGPEHVLLSEEAGGTVVPGEYLVRVHYRSDMGDLDPTGPVKGDVTILINEGTSEQSFLTIPFAIPSDDPDNIDPGSTGPDWADIATVDVMNGVITML